MVGLKKAVTCGSIIEDIKNEGRAEARAEGRAEGRVEASLNILKVLVTDPDFNLSLDLLVEKFGFTPEQILNGK